MSSPMNKAQSVQLCYCDQTVSQTVEKFHEGDQTPPKSSTNSYILKAQRGNIDYSVLTKGLTGRVMQVRVCAACLVVLVASGRGHTCSASLRIAYAKQTYRSYICTMYACALFIQTFTTHSSFYYTILQYSFEAAHTIRIFIVLMQVKSHYYTIGIMSTNKRS